MISSSPNLSNPREQLILNLGEFPIASLIWVSTEPTRQSQLPEAMSEIVQAFKLQPGYVGAALHKGRLQSMGIRSRISHCDPTLVCTSGFYKNSGIGSCTGSGNR